MKIFTGAVENDTLAQACGKALLTESTHVWFCHRLYRVPSMAEIVVEDYSYHGFGQSLQNMLRYADADVVESVTVVMKSRV